MDSGLTTLGAAIIGGVITLSTVWVTQRGAKEQRRQEEHTRERIRLEDLQRDRQHELIAQRRVCYTAYNSAARTTRDALKNCMHALKRGSEIDPHLRDKLEEEWHAYVIQHAQAHMIVSDEVLELIGTVNSSLRVMYGILQRIGQSQPAADDSVATLEKRLEDLWPRLEVMRSAMRRDLGVAEPERP